MKTLLPGATGNCGQRLLKAALERGHELTVFVRNPEKLTQQLRTAAPANIRVISGDVYVGKDPIYREIP